MNTHIVRVDEKIEKIATTYNLTTDEIMKINHHIKDWQHLVPGTKLKLPEIPEIVQSELDDTEPFIEEYYPKINIDDYHKIKEEKPLIQEDTPPDPIKEVKEKPTKHPSYNPYYNMPYNYYDYYYGMPYPRLRRKTNKKNNK